MKARIIWLTLGLAFVVTLAVVIGQRLSAEAMAVMVGVVAGVAASIPTSLIVVWFATRTLGAISNVSQPAPPAMPQPEPRVVVMAQPPQAQTYPIMNGLPSNGLYPPAAMPALGPRQFNVIGGADFSTMESAQPEVEVVWPR
jgi:hypothetical protein